MFLRFVRFTVGRITNLIFMDDGNFYVARAAAKVEKRFLRIYRIITHHLCVERL